MAKTVFAEVGDRATGDFADREHLAPRHEGADLSDFAPIPSGVDADIPGLMIKGGPEAATGWRLLAGAVEIDGDIRNTALLLSPDLEIERFWPLEEIAIDGEEPRIQAKKLVHGIEILPDGSIIFAFDGGSSLQRFDVCAERVWATGGHFHHAVTYMPEERAVWTFLEDDGFVKVDAENGEILRRISVEDIIRANPDMDLIELRRLQKNAIGTNRRDTPGKWLEDPIHFNDVDPLPTALQDAFPQFAAGDLLLSARSLNAVFVLDPQTSKIKWWRIGATRRQHDPDWEADGRISVFDNRMGRAHSEIAAIDPKTFEKEVLFDGRKIDFYTRIRGKHQTLENGAIVISSPQQGRAFEIGPDGAVRLEILNTKSGEEASNYVLTEMRFLPPDFFETDMENVQCPLKN